MDNKRTGVEAKIELTLLSAFYGPLLTQKQQQCLNLWLEEDLSLAEIAGEAGVSRQGVHDTLRRAEQQLYQLEDKLCLLSKFRRMEAGLTQVKNSLEELHDPRLDKPIRQLKTLLEEEEEEENGL